MSLSKAAGKVALSDASCKAASIVFVIDGTASMGTTFSQLQTILTRVSQLFAISGIKISILVFGDYEKAENFLSFESVLTFMDGDLESVIHQLNSYKVGITNGSGGDVAEAHRSAVAWILTNIEEPSHLFWISDAPPHGENYKLVHDSTIFIDGSSITLTSKQNTESGDAKEIEDFILHSMQLNFPFSHLIDLLMKRGHCVHFISGDGIVANQLAYNTINGVYVNACPDGKDNNGSLEEADLFHSILAILGYILDGSVTIPEIEDYTFRFPKEKSTFVVTEDIEPSCDYFNVFCAWLKENPTMINYLMFFSKVYFKSMRLDQTFTAEHSKMVTLLSQNDVAPEIIARFKKAQFNYINWLDLYLEASKREETQFLVFDPEILSAKIEEERTRQRMMGNHQMPFMTLDELLEQFKGKCAEKNKCMKDLMTQLPKWCKRGLHLLFSCLRVDNKRGLPLSDFAKNPTFLASFIDADSEGDAPEYSKGILPVMLSMLLKKCKDLIILEIASDWVKKPSFLSSLSPEATSEMPEFLCNGFVCNYIAYAISKTNPEKCKILNRIAKLAKIVTMVKNSKLPDFQIEVDLKGMHYKGLMNYLEKMPMCLDVLLGKHYPTNLFKFCPHDEVVKIVARIFKDPFYNTIPRKRFELVLAMSETHGGLCLSTYSINGYRDDYATVKQLLKPAFLRELDIPSIFTSLETLNQYYTEQIGAKGENAWNCKMNYFKMQHLTDQGAQFRCCNYCGKFYCRADSSHGDHNTAECFECRAMRVCPNKDTHLADDQKPKHTFTLQQLPFLKRGEPIKCDVCGCKHNFPRPLEPVTCKVCSSQIQSGLPGVVSSEVCIFCSVKPRKDIQNGNFQNLILENIDFFSTLWGIHPDILKGVITELSVSKGIKIKPTDPEEGEAGGGSKEPTFSHLHDLLFNDPAWAKTLEGDKLTKHWTQPVTYAGCVIHNTDEIMEIVDAGFEYECGICYDTFNKHNISSFCGKCPNKFCWDCIKGHLAANDITDEHKHEPIGKGHLGCPICSSPFRRGIKHKTEHLIPNGTLRNLLLGNKELSKALIDGSDGNDYFKCSSQNCLSPIPICTRPHACGAAGAAVGAQREMKFCAPCELREQTRLRLLATRLGKIDGVEVVIVASPDEIDTSKTAPIYVCGDMMIRVCSRCNTGVTKSEACNHMTCRCGNHFCLFCGFTGTAPEIYDHLHTAHPGMLFDHTMDAN